MIFIPIGTVLTLIVGLFILAILIYGIQIVFLGINAATGSLPLSVPIWLTSVLVTTVSLLLLTLSKWKSLQKIKDPLDLLDVTITGSTLSWSLNARKSAKYTRSRLHGFLSFVLGFFSGFLMILFNPYMEGKTCVVEQGVRSCSWGTPEGFSDTFVFFSTLIFPLFVIKFLKPSRLLEIVLKNKLKGISQHLHEVKQQYEEVQGLLSQARLEAAETGVRSLTREAEKIEASFPQNQIEELIQSHKWEEMKHLFEQLKKKAQHLKEYSISYQDKKSKDVLKDYQEFQSSDT